LDGPFPKLCPAVTLSHQDGHHSAVALLLKAALIQVSDYRLLGASGLKQKIGMQSNFFLEKSKDTEVYFKANIIKLGKKKICFTCPLLS
jgi:hypothetical protein